MKETVSAIRSQKSPPFITDPMCLNSFDTAATSRMLPPSFPRAITLFSFEDTLNTLAMDIDQLSILVSMSSSLTLVEVMDFFDKFSLRSPDILVRSLLLTNFIPPSTGKVFNRVRMPDMITDELRHFNLAAPVHPTYRATLMAHDDVRLVMMAYQESAAHVLTGIYSAKCNTRARQREKLAYVLEDLGMLQADAERVDAVIDSVLRDRFNDKAVTQVGSGVGKITTRCRT